MILVPGAVLCNMCLIFEVILEGIFDDQIMIYRAIRERG